MPTTKRTHRGYTIRALEVSPAQQASFWSKCQIIIATGCIEWMGSYRTHAGYGKVQLGDKVVIASRLSYALAYGVTPGNMFVCHTCDNPRCVRPDHLFLGTPLENAQDRGIKGRTSHGEYHHRSKLTEMQVLAIRQDDRPLGVIAAEYGVSDQAVRAIKERRSWRHI